MTPSRVAFTSAILVACQLVTLALAGISPTPVTAPASACEKCPKNEVYSKCGNNGCQNTCANPNIAQVCRAICMPGCICAEGYLRNSMGVCVVPEKCDSCKANEIFSKCDNHGCQNTCAEPDLITRCDYMPGCYPGCICKPGFLRDSSGDCICETLCKCGENEQYSDSGKTICENTCENPRKSTMCKAKAEPGCGCKEGYLRNEDGRCVLPEDCGGCGGDPNAQYSACGDPCPATCSNPNGPRCKMCLAEGGCACKEGYVKNHKGKCILPSECPQCGPNEVFACGSACDTTCATLGDACPIVNIQCNDQCYCVDGYARDENNVCIPIDQCPPKFECCKKEKYNACPMSCPPEETCRNYIEGLAYSCAAEPEPRVCVPRCECQDGYIRKIENGDCILPKNCCDDPNAEVVECPNPCPGGTCESPEFAPCRVACRFRGCQCKSGYVKDSDGKCIKLSKCPVRCSEPNQEYKECGTKCPATCDNRNPICTEECVPGCFCKDGFILQNEECIAIEHCPERCPGQNEEYSDCGGCTITCENKDTPFACAAVCRQGCFCKEGFVRKDGVCVPPEECPPKCTKPNEEYKECGTECPATCDDRNPFCTRNCVSGCFCKEGFILQDGECILIENCPSRCPKPNEEFKDCGTRCPATCDNRNPMCTMECVSGCFCKEGFILHDGECISIDDCPPQCKVNEVFKECGTKCPPTCDNRIPRCTKECVSGCFCVDGFILHNGLCIPIEKCPFKCKENEVYEECPSPCPPERSCASMFSGIEPMCPVQLHPDVCIPRCGCKEGYVRNEQKVCVLPEKCCTDPNSELVDNPNCCPGGTCANPTFFPCRMRCNRKGCQCKKGFLKKSDSDSTCIPVKSCPKPTERPTTTSSTTKCSTAKPTQATKSTKFTTVKPTVTTKPTNCSTAKPTVATKPTKCSTAKPTEATKPTKCSTAKPTETTKPTKCSTAKPTEATKSIKCTTAKPTEATKPTKCSTAKPTEKTKPTKCSTAKPTKYTKPTPIICYAPIDEPIDVP